MRNQMTLISPQCRGTMKHLSTACWDDKGGVGVFFDASKQYTCLQSPWPPFAKYISHIPVAPFNTESAKRDLNRFSSPKLGQGSLENYLGFVGGGNDNTCIVISIGTQCCIGVAVLVNNCFFW